jgi:hypothetical protein
MIGVEMAKLIYAAIASLDGYVEDEEGRFDWAMPDEEVHAFANDLERPIGTYLYGRRMYETMVLWETASTEADEPAAFRGHQAKTCSREQLLILFSALVGRGVEKLTRPAIFWRATSDVYMVDPTGPGG